MISVLDLDVCLLDLFVLCLLDLPVHFLTFLWGCGHLLDPMAMSPGEEKRKVRRFICNWIKQRREPRVKNVTLKL